MNRRPLPRLMLIFPSSSVELMGGSIGELTALMRFARDLRPDQCEISHAEAFRAADPHPRVASLLEGLTVPCLFELPSMARRFAGPAPNIAVFASYRAFFQFPRFPDLMGPLLESWLAEGTRLFAIDPCGDSFTCPPLPVVKALLPVPFTYALPAGGRQKLFSIRSEARARSAGATRWLWVAAPWMAKFARFRAAERVALLGLERSGIDFGVLSPLDERLAADAPRLRDDASYDDLDAEVARHAVLVTPNCRSVLAARAAARGVPLVYVDPFRLPDEARYDDETARWIAKGREEAIHSQLLPAEFTTLEAGEPEQVAAAVADLDARLHELQDAQNARCRGYGDLPDAAACIGVGESPS
jgi:hypothetical protein